MKSWCGKAQKAKGGSTITSTFLNVTQKSSEVPLLPLLILCCPNVILGMSNVLLTSDPATEWDLSEIYSRMSYLQSAGCREMCHDPGHSPDVWLHLNLK